jgi:hypothetical protein
VKKTRQNKNLEPRSDSIGTEKAPTAMVWVRRLRETGSVAPARLGRSQAFSAQRGALLLERTKANDTALRRLGMGVSPEFSVRDGLHSVFQRKPAPDLNRIDTGSREANALNKESEPPFDSIETEKAPGRLSRGLELRGWRQAELKKNGGGQRAIAPTLRTARRSWRGYQDRYEPAERLIFIATSISRRPGIEIWTGGHDGQSRQSKRQSRTPVRSRRCHSLYLAARSAKRSAPGFVDHPHRIIAGDCANYSEILGLCVNQIAVMHRDVSRVGESIFENLDSIEQKPARFVAHERTLCGSYLRCASLIILTALPPATAQIISGNFRLCVNQIAVMHRDASRAKDRF